MNPTVLLAGATGLVGGAFLDLMKNEASCQIIALTRREIPSLIDAPHIRQEIIDFDNLEKHKQLLAAQSAICALGTTIKKAGSKEDFRRVDHQLPLQIAQYALENGCQNFVLISAVGADPDSKVFYNRVKGEVERDIQKLPFRSIHIIRPSLLLGEREEFRWGEEIAKIFLKPFRFLIPAKYRPVHAIDIARKIYSVLKNPSKGVYIYEGRQISE